MTIDLEERELLPCPFCGERLICDPNEGAPFWVHRNRLKSVCWLADAWVKDELDGEGGILEWNTRASPSGVEEQIVAWFKSLGLHAIADQIKRGEYKTGGAHRVDVQGGATEEVGRPYGQPAGQASPGAAEEASPPFGDHQAHGGGQ